jgi:hypothetical protein
MMLTRRQNAQLFWANRFEWIEARSQSAKVELLELDSSCDDVEVCVREKVCVACGQKYDQ